MAIYDLIIFQTSQPVVITGSEKKKTVCPSTPRFLGSKKISRLHQPNTFFCQPPTTEWLFGGYHNLLVMGNGWHLLMTQGVFKKNLPKHITDKSKTFEVLFRAISYRWHPIIISTQSNGGCLPSGCLDEISFLAFRFFCYVLCVCQFS